MSDKDYRKEKQFPRSGALAIAVIFAVFAFIGAAVDTAKENDDPDGIEAVMFDEKGDVRTDSLAEERDKLSPPFEKMNHTHVDVLFGKLLVGLGKCEFDKRDNLKKGGGIWWPCLLYAVPESQQYVWLAVPVRDDDAFDNHAIWRIYKVATKDGKSEIVYRDGEVSI